MSSSSPPLSSHPAQALLFAETADASPALPAPAATARVPDAGPEKSPGAARRRARPDRLWLCLHLPWLPLEVCAGSAPAAGPQAVFVEAGQSGLLLSVDDTALALGLRSGMPVNAALALVPDLVLHPRRPERERDAFEALASRAGHYSPMVSPEPEDALLLEVGGSLKLFGGLRRLRSGLQEEAAALGHRIVIAGAPTPRAALWLARARRPVILRAAALPAELGSVPLTASGWPERSIRRLRQMGIATLGECLRLPRQGFARRFGPEKLRELEQGFGRDIEIRPLHRPAALFRERLELEVESRDLARILPGLQMLLDRLGLCLRARQAGVRLLWFRFFDAAGHESRRCLRLRQASADIPLLFELLRLRLEAEPVEHDVCDLALDVRLEDLAVTEGEGLFGPEAAGDEGIAILLERLRSRLGEEAVQGLALAPEHRPERAWRRVDDPLKPVRQGGETLSSAARPLWLLPAPARLRCVADRLHWNGPLTLVRGPERIETGWWDGDDVRRDYYIACNGQGFRLWVFEDLRSGHWYLHGLFG